MSKKKDKKIDKKIDKTIDKTIDVLVLKPVLTDKQLDKKEGQTVSEEDCKHIITKDTDGYGIDENGNNKLLFKFRKNCIPDTICVKAYNALEEHAQKKNYNRGAAAGKISLKKLPHHVGKITKTDKYRVFYKTKSGKLSGDNVGNSAMSNIIGYYDRPDRNFYNKKYINNKHKIAKFHSKKATKTKTDIHGVPMCRTTQFTREQVEKWKSTLPLIEYANKLFKQLVPDRYSIQLKKASLTPDFQINKTAYSTITINYDWRTSIHKDSGDLEEGFGNLIVLEKAKSGHPECKGFTGGMLTFPKYSVAIDLKQGDYLAMDVHQYHANTKIEGEGRLSIVCYLRKKMINCIKSK